ncbi:hypothetical protein NL676_030688 [Syzygium grande]|nr:hypothetical protein NL676_030688 [Syzygium grande]
MESGTNWGSTKRRLECSNVVKHYDYDTSSLLHSPNDSSSSASASLHTCYPDIIRSRNTWGHADPTRPPKTPPSIYPRIGVRRVDKIPGRWGERRDRRICRNLGLSGIDDFAIPTTTWEARKIRLSSDLLSRLRKAELDGESQGKRRREEGALPGPRPGLSWRKHREGEDKGHYAHVCKLHGSHCRKLELEDKEEQREQKGGERSSQPPKKEEAEEAKGKREGEGLYLVPSQKSLA